MSRVKRARSRVSLESAPDPDPLCTPSSPHRFLGASEVAPSFLHRGRVTQNVCPLSLGHGAVTQGSSSLARVSSSLDSASSFLQRRGCRACSGPDLPAQPRRGWDGGRGREEAPAPRGQ